MKKRLMNILLWDHFCQVLFILSAIPSIIVWIKGHAMPWDGFLIGWNFGCAFYWQFYLTARKLCDKWMERAMRPRNSELEEMLTEAQRLVEARMKSAHINTDLN